MKLRFSILHRSSDDINLIVLVKRIHAIATETLRKMKSNVFANTCSCHVAYLNAPDPEQDLSSQIHQES